jgi:phosphatidylinositol glycan class B
LVPTALLVALAVRILPALILPQTAFQPDEFWQSLEPAHVLAFGYGHLTWEWRDLPVALTGDGGGDGWYERIVVAGRMRGWIWPGLFALIYKGITALGVEERFLTVSSSAACSLKQGMT